MTIRLGIIGGGNISETHARAARAIPGVEIAAIYGTNAEKVRRLTQEFGGTGYSEFDKFLDHRPMDFVAIGSPSGLHAEQGIAAARRGLHVLTEKPLDINTRQADLLITAAAEAKVLLGVFFQDRFKPDILRAKQWIDAGILGKPILADARVKWFRPDTYYSGSRWRGTLALDGGGALINQAIHTVDLLLWLFGEVASVQAQSSVSLHEIEAEDTLLALLEFSSGAKGVLQAATSVFPGYPRKLELSGSEGTLIIEHDRLIAADLRTPPTDFQAQGNDANRSASSPVVNDFRGHQSVIADFLEAMETKKSPRCSGREGRRSVALVEAIYTACRTGARVLLQD